MWLVYGAWAWLVITTLVKWSNQGDVAAANHFIPGLVIALVIHGGVLLYLKNKRPEEQPKKQPAHQEAHMEAEPDSSIEQRIFEESLYAVVAEEIQNNQIRDGLMAKALAEADGNKDRERSLYIKYRIQSIKDEIELAERQARYEEKREHFEQAAKNLAESEINAAEQAKWEAEKADYMASSQAEYPTQEITRVNYKHRTALVFLWPAFIFSLLAIVVMIFSLFLEDKAGFTPLEIAGAYSLGFLFYGGILYVVTDKISKLKW